MPNDAKRVSSNPIYMAWKNMRQRCLNTAHPRYSDYGGRGISICARWEDFELFVIDLGPKPFEGAQIDRKDNEGNYTPDNCKWTTLVDNSRNSRNTKLTVVKVSAIKAVLKDRAGTSVRALAASLGKEYNVAPATIREIALGRSWKEVI